MGGDGGGAGLFVHDIVHESKTLATITFQNYFRMYKKLAGMTGTAQTEADEFREIYSLDVVEIPMLYPLLFQQGGKDLRLFDGDGAYQDGLSLFEFTGRLMIGRRYNEGLHQAIEAKEGVKVAHESKTLATITRTRSARRVRANRSAAWYRSVDLSPWPEMIRGVLASSIRMESTSSRPWPPSPSRTTLGCMTSWPG